MKIIGIAMRESIASNGQPVVHTYQRLINTLKNYEDVTIMLLSPIEKNTEYLLNFCDGFIIPGGADIDPKYYHQENYASLEISETLDNLDKNIVFHAFKTSKPLLGICRGMQSINVFLGGSLIQDLENTRYKHSGFSTPYGYHPVELKNSIYFQSLPSTFEVTSSHHQAIDKLGNDLASTGFCEEVIEIIEHRFKPIIGVQFHPEFEFDSKNSQQILNIFYSLVHEKNPF